MITVPVAITRGVLGPWSDAFSDEQISDPSLATTIEAELEATCATWGDITDTDDLARLNTAIGYLAAARLISRFGGVKSMTLGDQVITFNSSFVEAEQSRWRRDGLSMITSVCPVKDNIFGTGYIGPHFGLARGRRG